MGEIATEVYDLAVVDQQLYGLKKRSRKGFSSRSTMNLIKIDPATGQSTVVGNTGLELAGLSYNPADKKLYATAADKIVVIDLKTGKGSVVVTLSDRDRVCGEIAFDSTGKFFITLTGTDRKKYLATCNLKTGKVSLIGDTGFPGLASMKFMGDTLYGVAGNYPGLGGTDGQIVRIDTATGKAVLFNTTIPAARWAGIAIVPQPAVGQPGSRQTDSSSASPKTSSSDSPKAMPLLTIDTKENCYIINTEGMKSLQETVASTHTLNKGSYSIRIKSGQYQHAKGSADQEPFVLLWLYGNNNSSFVNKNTGCKVGTTWTTLNGYDDILKLEAEEPVYLHALFFGFEGVDSAGSVTLEIAQAGSNKAPHSLTVDAQQNSFLLKPALLSELTQADKNSRALAPGNYRFKIRESTASYWSDQQKFQLEPWAVLRIQGGKFVNSLTGAEVSESWCSLNGLQDDFILEVKEKTTVTGFFFDTYREDNEGQIILTVDTIAAAEVARAYQKREQSGAAYRKTEQTAGQTVRPSTAKQAAGQQATGQQSQSSQSSSKEFSFNFQFDANQMEEVWQQVASQAEASISTTAPTDTSYQWDQLESLIMRNSQAQVKTLATQVAKMKFLMKTLMQQIELSFNQTFEAWSGYFDQRLIELLDTQIITIIEDQISAKLLAQRGEERTEITKTIQSELDRRISSTLENRVVNLRNDVSASVTKDMTQSVSEAVKRLEEQLALKVAAQSNDINVSVTKVFQSELDKRITATLESQISSLRGDIIASVTKDVTQNISEAAQRLEAQLTLKVADQSEDIKALVTQDFQNELEKRIDINLESKVVNLRSDVSSIVNREMASSISSAVKMDVLADIKKQQLAFDVSAFRGEIGKFYAQLAQFETKINARIAQGDTDLYHWTLEQLVRLQSCITDRQALAGLFESFSAELKDKLESAPCVQPARFNAWVRETPQIEPPQPKQLSGKS